MHRCALSALALAGALFGLSAHAERPFPPQALRGELVIQQPPVALLNGRNVRLAPGARIRGENNLLQMSGALSAQELVVHYTLDFNGQLKDVWVLTAAERAREPWPETAEQAATWRFDPVGQRWTKP